MISGITPWAFLQDPPFQFTGNIIWTGSGWCTPWNREIGNYRLWIVLYTFCIINIINPYIHITYIIIYNISAPQFHWCNLLGSNTQTFRYQTPREGLVKMPNLQHGCPLLPAHRDNSAHEQRPWLLLDGIGSANCDVKHWTLQNNNHGKRHLGILQHYCSTKERQNCNRRACRKVRASFWLILLLGPEGKPQIESSRYQGRLPFSTWEVDSPLRIL